MILLALGLLADTDIASLFTAITMDIGMCVTGFAAALITSSHLLRWVVAASAVRSSSRAVRLLVKWQAEAVANGTSEMILRD